MPDKGIIRGTHHLTFCVGGAQEDYDFHTKVLGMKSVKKTVLFDGEIPIYHLYYGNDLGESSTLLTSFPYGQAGWKGKQGTNQAKRILVSVPKDSIGYWADRLKEHGIEAEQVTLFGTERLHFSHPCGLPFGIVADPEEDDRPPYEGNGVPGEHAIRGAYGTTTSIKDEPDLMDFFITEGMGGRRITSEGPNHQYEIGDEKGYGRKIELVQEPNLAQGSWTFGEGTIHHHAFDVLNEENQQTVKDWIVGLGFTDISERKDRGYFFSMYCRSPSGLLVELAYAPEDRGFLMDEKYEEMGSHMCIPPHWEHRRDEISMLEPINAG